jgi:hypothetical protein
MLVRQVAQLEGKMNPAGLALSAGAIVTKLTRIALLFLGGLPSPRLCAELA